MYEEDGEHNEVSKGKHDRIYAVGTSIASAPVIAILKGGPRLYIGVEGGVANESVDDSRALNTFYWRQMDN